MIPDTFHFLRPEWLWAVLPVAALAVLALRRRRSGDTEGWAAHVDAHLLRHLAIPGKSRNHTRVIPAVILVAALGTILGLAGPTWTEREQPTFEGGTPVVAVLSLAQSMNADDLTPTRLKRSVHKLRDILARTEGDERGLVIYADAPFVAAPLTTDPRVIDEMLPELSTSLMPVLGNRLDLAIDEAAALLDRAGAFAGDIVVMADDAGNDPAKTLAAAKAARAEGYTVSVLGAGTEDGATLQTADGRAIADNAGQTFMTRLDRDTLERVAATGGGHFSMITAGDADLDRILPESARTIDAAGEKLSFQGDAWVDMGYWLLIIPALLLPFAFRRGLIFAVALVFTTGFSAPRTASAGVWDDLWATPDQQGHAAFETGDYATAAELFEAPAWQGSADYRAGDFAEAARAFAGDPYNRGNALAKSGDFEAALAAYDAALEADPSDEDARFNRDLIAKLLEQQKQEQENQQQAGGEQDQKQAGGQQDQQQAGGEQDQQQAGGAQDQQQARGEQDQQQAGAEQDQQQAGGEQDQQQAGGEQDQQQAGGEQDQQQAGGAQDQQQTGAEQDQQQAGAEQDQQQAEGQQDQQQPGNQQGEERAEGQQPEQAEQSADAGTPEDRAEARESLAQRLGEMLTGGNGEEQQPDAGNTAAAPAPQPLDQAIEQQLRRVPDDPSGLLRARIRQHYLSLRAGQ